MTLVPGNNYDRNRVAVQTGDDRTRDDVKTETVLAGNGRRQG
jgi:hypothetical protein